MSGVVAAPWPAKRMTREQFADLRERIPTDLGLVIDGRSEDGPWSATLMNDGHLVTRQWSQTDPYSAADRALRHVERMVVDGNGYVREYV